MRPYPDIMALRARKAELVTLLRKGIYPDLAEELRDVTRVEDRSAAYAQGWGTCLPLLAGVVAASAATHGPILEIGSGLSSTPLLLEMARATGRRLVTLESNLAWMNVNEDLHHPEFLHVPDWAELPALIAELETQHPGLSAGKDGGPYWSMIFIDNDPGHTRVENVLRCRGRSEYLVAHDTHNPWFRGLDEALDAFVYRFDYTLMTACTSVVSDYAPYAPSAKDAP